MYLFYSICMCAVALVVLYLLWYYPNAQTTILVKLLVGLAWFASLSVLVLVPEDVAQSFSASNKSEDLYSVSEGLLGKFWLVIYWTMISFIILVLPFLQKYSDSGGFSIRDRCEYALRTNAKLFALIITVLTSVFLIIFLLEKKVTFSKFVGWLMAVLNAYGLIGAICLMGYGLVDIPRKLWQKANHPERQNFLFQTAGQQIEKAAAAHLELSKQINSVKQFDGQFGSADPMRPYMDVIVGMLDRVSDFQPQETEEDENDVNMETDTRQGLGLIRQRLRKGIEGYYRERERYLSIVNEYLYLHETMENENRRGGPFVFQNGRQRPILLRYWARWWRCSIKPLTQRAMAIITGILSILIVVAEVSIANYLPNFSAFARILEAMKSDQVALICTTFICLFYAMTCMYYTLIRLGRFSFYLLVPKHTAPFSLVSNALLLCRFVCPLCFNFFTALALPIKDHESDGEVTAKDTAFWDHIGRRISEMPLLGKYFTTYLPVLILPYVLLIFFNGVNRVMSFLDPKLKFSFNDDWHLDLDSNYASNGRQVLNLEVEYYQKGWEPGLTIVEGMRLAGVPNTGGGPSFLHAQPGSSHSGGPIRRSPEPFSNPFTRSSTPRPMRSEITNSSPFFRRSSSLDATAIRLNAPNIPDSAYPDGRATVVRQTPSAPLNAYRHSDRGREESSSTTRPPTPFSKFFQSAKNNN